MKTLLIAALFFGCCLVIAVQADNKQIDSISMLRAQESASLELTQLWQNIIFTCETIAKDNYKEHRCEFTGDNLKTILEAIDKFEERQSKINQVLNLKYGLEKVSFPQSWYKDILNLKKYRDNRKFVWSDDQNGLIALSLKNIVMGDIDSCKSSSRIHQDNYGLVWAPYWVYPAIGYFPNLSVTDSYIVSSGINYSALFWPILELLSFVAFAIIIVVLIVKALRRHRVNFNAALKRQAELEQQRQKQAVQELLDKTALCGHVATDQASRIEHEDVCEKCRTIVADFVKETQEKERQEQIGQELKAKTAYCGYVGTDANDRARHEEVCARCHNLAEAEKAEKKEKKAKPEKVQVDSVTNYARKTIPSSPINQNNYTSLSQNDQRFNQQAERERIRNLRQQNNLGDCFRSC